MAVCKKWEAGALAKEKIPKICHVYAVSHSTVVYVARYVNTVVAYSNGVPSIGHLDFPIAPPKGFRCVDAPLTSFHQCICV